MTIAGLRELLVAARPINLELSGSGFEVWSDDHPIHHTSYVWAEGSDDNMLLVMRAINALPALLDVAEAAKAYMEIRHPHGDLATTTTWAPEMDKRALRLMDALAGMEGGKS